MNFTESFQEFSTRLSRTDLALYAGIGIALWVLFKDRMSPVQKIVFDLVNKAKTVLNNSPSKVATSVVVTPVVANSNSQDEDVFFQLVTSWKQTRDLAVKSKCSQAVKVADQMFPFLSPSVCNKEETTNDK